MTIWQNIGQAANPVIARPLSRSLNCAWSRVKLTAINLFFILCPYSIHDFWMLRYLWMLSSLFYNNIEYCITNQTFDIYFAYHLHIKNTHYMGLQQYRAKHGLTGENNRLVTLLGTISFLLKLFKMNIKMAPNCLTIGL